MLAHQSSKSVHAAVLALNPVPSWGSGAVVVGALSAANAAELDAIGCSEAGIFLLMDIDTRVEVLLQRLSEHSPKDILLTGVVSYTVLALCHAGAIVCHPRFCCVLSSTISEISICALPCSK